MNTKIRIRKPDDFHCHFRTGFTLISVMYFTAKHFARAIVMPNTSPAVLNEHDVETYRREIHNLISFREFLPLMTFQITAQTTPEMIRKISQTGTIAGKLYPQGVTTNSENGVTNFTALYSVFEEMQKNGLLLLLHGEDPGRDVICLHREKMFLPTLYGIATDFPKLKIVLEHITTRDAVEMVGRLPNVAATITAHHLVLTIDDVIGDLIRPHHFCKPIAKMPEDRSALIKAATSGNPKFFFGSDTAPHPRGKKICSAGCAGIFSAPVALPLLAQIFEEQGCLDKLEGFASTFGAEFYGLPQNKQSITLEKKEWVVPRSHKGITIFKSGETLHWKVTE